MSAGILYNTPSLDIIYIYKFLNVNKCIYRFLEKLLELNLLLPCLNNFGIYFELL